MTASGQDREQIAAVIDTYRRGFATMNVDDLIAIWDQDHDDLVYVAMEEAGPRRTWKDIEAYYRHALPADPTFHVVAMQVETLSIGLLEDVAHVLCRFRFEGEQEGQEDPVIAEGRATFVLHRHRASWKVVHYHESARPPSPERRPSPGPQPDGRDDAKS
ncbi:YybH family protein [Actinomadura sp. 9N407]|uniref:YybH family protein n=1 Tax=Actinomadura sp. 9N407 TaxID=3375154 RepID=UPI0037AF7F02